MPKILLVALTLFTQSYGHSPRGRSPGGHSPHGNSPGGHSPHGTSPGRSAFQTCGVQ